MTSDRGATSFSAGARLFSGRADPSWTVDAATARALLALWQTLPGLDQWAEPPAALGYRGCWLRAPTGTRWLSYDGVALQEEGTRMVARRDERRAFERAILRTAPTGALPPELIPGSRP